MADSMNILKLTRKKQFKFYAIWKAIRLKLTYSLAETWKRIRFRRNCSVFSWLSDTVHLSTECRIISEKVWWWMHNEMYSKIITPFAIKYVMPTIILKEISPRYPIKVDWSHGKLKQVVLKTNHFLILLSLGLKIMHQKSITQH